MERGLSTTSAPFDYRVYWSMGHFFRVTLRLFFSFFSLCPKKRFSKQYSKECKDKEVSEGEESKDFWNVLGGKANFLSLSGGLYCTILCIFGHSK